ncbi:MAG: cupin-like domain-containing protein [Gemmataceae bacterium]
MSATASATIRSGSAALLELARSLPPENVEYNAGRLPITCDPKLTPRTGLSIEETVRRIAECKSWMVLKYVEHDPDYRALLGRCLDEVKVHSESLRPGMELPQAFIFLTSPGSITPYHMDPEHNFLLQIRGTKKIHLFDPRDPSILSQEELERFYRGAHRNMVFRDENRTKAWVYDLEPGFGLHFPVTAPHWVENGSEVSISFSITFRTPDLERRSILHSVNGYLRERGFRPAPVGRHPWRDRVKCGLFRAVRKVRRLFGRAV